MSWPTAGIALRLRLPATASAGVGLVAVMAAVGALFPSVGHTIGTLNVPKSVSNLLGGGDYGTITGWFRSEIASIYGPLVIGALAITGASATTAGEEEDRIMAHGARPPDPTPHADRLQGRRDRGRRGDHRVRDLDRADRRRRRRRRRNHARAHGRASRTARLLRLRHRCRGDRRRRRHGAPVARLRGGRRGGHSRLADQQLRALGRARSNGSNTCRPSITTPATTHLRVASTSPAPSFLAPSRSC